MIIGELDRVITIQKRTSWADTNGERLEKWADVDEVWAKVIQRHGRETFQNGQTVASRDDRFKVYFLEDLNEADYRVVYKGRVYDIESIITLGDDEGQELVCRYKDNIV